MKHRMAGSRPTRANLVETLDNVVFGLETVDQHALIVLDGLDEYPLIASKDSSERQGTSVREDVLHWLEQFRIKHLNVHLLLLSRDEADIRSKMWKAMRIDVAECVDGDLTLFIQKSIDRILREKPWKKKHESQLLSRFRDNNERQVQLQL